MVFPSPSTAACGVSSAEATSAIREEGAVASTTGVSTSIFSTTFSLSTGFTRGTGRFDMKSKGFLSGSCLTRAALLKVGVAGSMVGAGSDGNTGSRRSWACSTSNSCSAVGSSGNSGTVCIAWRNCLALLFSGYASTKLPFLVLQSLMSFTQGGTS